MANTLMLILDTCYYGNYNVKCGDQCISGYNPNCECGNSSIQIWDGKQCCVPPVEEKLCSSTDEYEIFYKSYSSFV